MFWHDLKLRLQDFRNDERGSFMVESVIALPLLFWTVAATFEFFEVHRYKSVREKATYTIADMISREQDAVTDVYMDNAKALFDIITGDDGINQLRVSIIRYDGDDEEYEIFWSKVRGTGTMDELDDNDVADDHDRLPVLADGEDVIVVESVSRYNSLFNLVISDPFTIETRVFTSIRFAPQICFDACGS
jgi:hypothetical protein